MTVYVIDSANPLPPVSGEGETALSLGNNDTVILAEGSTIAAHGRNGWGIFGGQNNTLLIDGSVYSAWETGIAVHGTITIGATGIVDGNDFAIQLLNDPVHGQSSVLNNAGLITSAEGFALGLSGH